MESNWQPGQTLEEREKADIIRALRHFSGDKAKTAMSLGISAKTLYNRLTKYESEEKANVERRVQAETRLRLESSSKLSSELPVSVRQREEVQKVSS